MVNTARWIVTARHMRFDSRHDDKLVAVKAQTEGGRHSGRAGVSEHTTQADASQRQREQSTERLEVIIV